MCQHIEVYIRLSKADPTKTTALSNAFVSDMKRRFKELKSQITKAIVTEDAFGLNQPTIYSASPVGKFNFPRSADKVNAFMGWLDGQVQKGILSVKEGAQLGQAVEGAWTNKYISDSYNRGITRGRYELGKAGFNLPAGTTAVGSMMNPFHIDRLGLLYSRTYSDLKGITNSMDNQISKVLSQAMGDGDNPRTIARKLNAVISGGGATLGITDSLGRFIPAERRAAMLARTEIIRAHHQATIQEYRNWNVEGVSVQAEFSALGDACPECQELATGGVNNDGIYTLDEIENMIPVHPNCRCLALPFLPEVEDVKTQEEAGVTETSPGESIPTEGTSISQVPTTGLIDDPVKEMFENAGDADDYMIYRKKYDKMFSQFTAEEKEAWITYVNSEDSPRGKVIVDIEGMRAKMQDTLGNSKEVFENFISEWQTNPCSKPCVEMKFQTFTLEKGQESFVIRTHYKEMAEKWVTDMDEGLMTDYIKIRAFNQSYMDWIGVADEITLYRGTGGNTGRTMSRALTSLSKTHRTKWTIQDANLTGYTDDIAIANHFGRNNSGVTVKIKIGKSEIFLHKDLIRGMTQGFWRENEFILIGKNRKINIKDLYF